MPENNSGLPRLSIDWILATDTETVVQTACQAFYVEIPQFVETIEDLNNAQAVISRSVSNYTYLDTISQMLKIRKREMKRNGAGKEALDDILSKEEMFTKLSEQMKSIFQATSRLITIRQMVLQELNMSNPR